MDFQTVMIEIFKANNKMSPFLRVINLKIEKNRTALEKLKSWAGKRTLFLATKVTSISIRKDLRNLNADFF